MLNDENNSTTCFKQVCGRKMIQQLYQKYDKLKINNHVILYKYYVI